MFYIGKKWDFQPISLFHGDDRGLWCATVKHDGLAWFCTELAPATLYETEAEAEAVIQASLLKWPDAQFKIFDENKVSISERQYRLSPWGGVTE